MSSVSQQLNSPVSRIRQTVSDRPALVYLLLGLPPVVLGWLVYRYAVNVPWFDDVEAFPGFLLKYLQASSGLGRVAELLRPNNEHRIVTGKLIALVSYHTTGMLNMRLLIFGGFAFLLGTWALLLYVFKRNRIPLAYAIPVSFLLFQPQFYLTTFWSITGLQHQPVVFLGFLSLYLLTNRGHRATMSLLGAIALAVLTTFTNGNGMFIWFAGLGVVLLQGRFSVAIAWLLSAMLTVSLYFSGFTTQGNEAGIAYTFEHPVRTLLSFFSFIGGLFDFLPTHESTTLRIVLPVLAGFGLVVWMLFWFSMLLLRPGANEPYGAGWSLIWTRLQAISRAEMFLVGCLLYLLTNAVIVALLRSRFGYDVILVSNYKLYPTLFLVLAYCLYVFSPYRQPVPGRRYQGLILLVGGLVSVLSYWLYTPLVIERRKTLLTQAVNQRYNGYGLGATPGSLFATFLAGTMNQLTSQKLYTYPHDPFMAHLDSMVAQPSFEGLELNRIPLFVRYEPDYIVVENQTVQLPTHWSREAAVMLRVYSPSYNVLFKADANLNWLNRQQPGFNMAIPRVLLPGADSGRVDVAAIAGQNLRWFQTGVRLGPRPSETVKAADKPKTAE
ncbi:hypothetical protein GCM10023189_30940 [Nibrella saemangeumensis]|uniref:Uncharacterized protein n=1 Tax=Nibrella saemangeumensis TaxID=1084526 RepID=A0ABP8MZ03_9BACT